MPWTAHGNLRDIARRQRRSLNFLYVSTAGLAPSSALCMRQTATPRPTPDPISLNPDIVQAGSLNPLCLLRRHTCVLPRNPSHLPALDAFVFAGGFVPRATVRLDIKPGRCCCGVVFTHDHRNGVVGNRFCVDDPFTGMMDSTAGFQYWEIGWLEFVGPGGSETRIYALWLMRPSECSLMIKIDLRRLRAGKVRMLSKFTY
jgi:hypothetical protein